MSSFLRSPTKNNNVDENASEMNPHGRVVLLLDMDCFYAQCETVRLGLDQSLPLALVQWRSALAVNYPAREFGIKRGDSFEVIQEKSKGKCIAIHLPVTCVDEETVPMTNTSPKQSKGDEESAISPHRSNDDNTHEVESSESAYDEEFNKPKDVREEMFLNERNIMRSPTEGKACLDRYAQSIHVYYSNMGMSLFDLNFGFAYLKKDIVWHPLEYFHSSMRYVFLIATVITF